MGIASTWAFDIWKIWPALLAPPSTRQTCTSFFFCEVGGHKKGLGHAGIEAGPFFGKGLDRDDIGANSEQNYLTVWQTTAAPPPRWQNDACSPQTGGIALAQKKVDILQLNSSLLFEPQLYLTEFTVTSYLHPGLEGCLPLGILHTRTSHKPKTPSMVTRIRIAREALGLMDARLAMLPHAVGVLAGDPTLTIIQAAPVVQPEDGDPDILRHWQIQTSNAGLAGDILFVKGTTSTTFDVSIGKSYADRGIRKDAHDFFGVTLHMPLGTHHDAAASSDAPQPAAQTAPSKRGRVGTERSQSASSSSAVVQETTDRGDV